MKRWTVRLGLSLMLAMGWWVQRLPAQAPTAPPPGPVEAPLVASPVLAPAPASPGSDQTPTSPYLLRRMLNRHGVGCYTTLNSPGCGSCHSEYIFFFGSCRQFFGEPCQPPAPHPWLHPFQPH
jgi:hypothetical protein